MWPLAHPRRRAVDQGPRRAHGPEQPVRSRADTWPTPPPRLPPPHTWRCTAWRVALAREDLGPPLLRAVQRLNSAARALASVRCNDWLGDLDGVTGSGEGRAARHLHTLLDHGPRLALLGKECPEPILLVRIGLNIHHLPRSTFNIREQGDLENVALVRVWPDLQRRVELLEGTEESDCLAHLFR